MISVGQLLIRILKELRLKKVSCCSFSTKNNYFHRHLCLGYIPMRRPSLGKNEYNMFLENLRCSSQTFRHSDMISNLRNCASVDEQLETLYETLSLTPQDVENRIEVCRTIEDTLKPFYPECSISLVGSSVNGFGTKGCDVDMSFRTGCAANKISLSEYGIVPSIKAVEDGTVALNDLYRMPVKAQLLFIRNILEERCPDCQNVSAVAGRCRILNFLNSKYNLKCDLSFNNNTAFYSTKLLHFYGKFDKRIPQLMVFLIYWIKRAKLVGGPARFKTYAISLLMIYFLQTRSPPIIPTVEQLFSESDFFTSNEVWDYQYFPSIGKMETSKNTRSTAELLKEFFFFCLYFDFMKAIRPLSGSSVDQSTLAFCDETGQKFEPNSICIQDPFDALWNVTCGVHFKFSKYFITKFVVACKLYQDETLWSPNNNNWGIIHLFDKDLEQRVLNDCSSVISFQIPPPYQSTDSGLVDDNINEKEKWPSMAAQAVLNILEYGFLFKCDVLEKRECCEPLRESITTSGSTRTIGYNNLPLLNKSNRGAILCLRCITRNTWNDREDIRMQLDPSEYNSANPLETEHVISVKLCEKKSNDMKQGFVFLCDCTETPLNGQTTLNVTFSCTTDKTVFPPKIAIFLKEYIPNIVRKLL